jgi:hypothetical protein
LNGQEHEFLGSSDTTIEHTDPLSNVCQLFSSFCGEKVKLLRSIGFDGLCKLPVHGPTDLRFYLWILNKVDVRRSALHLGPNHTIPITDNDIRLITGLPSTGYCVLRNEKSPLVRRSHASTVKYFLSLGSQDAKFSLDYVESVVRREYNSPMTNEERYGFCVAATLYALSRFLAVDRNQLRLPFELIHSLVDPLQIKSHNWCQLVRKCWLVQAMSVQNQISRGEKTIKVGGCPFIAQVGYRKNIIQISIYQFP